MLNAMQPLLSRLPQHKTLLDILLPRLTRLFQEEFIYWIDGGAGVGTSSASYFEIMNRELDDNARDKSIIALYDPLPENASILLDKFGDNSRFLVRQVALSGECGEAIFSIPARITSGEAGPWLPGTSFSGSLKHTAPGRERITVKTVRLADESLPRFDFVKLDLQGGEFDAIKGMGKKLFETKLLYVETQLLHDWGCLSFLVDNGFLILFDRLQFGFSPGTKYLPYETLSKAGISVDRVHLPQQSGMPLICWGHFDPSVGMLDPTTFVLMPELAGLLQEAGVNYLQTDAICINVNYLPQFIRATIAANDFVSS